MIEIILKIFISYLLGSLMGGLVLGKLTGTSDIRETGSKSAGATNALRTHGKAFGAGVFIIDIAKGLLAVIIIAPFQWSSDGQEAMSAMSVEMLQVWCGLAAVLGHLYPVFFGFRGGKGVATLLGAMMGISPVVLLVALGGWVIILLLTGYVSLASIGAGIVGALYCIFLMPGWGTTPAGIFTIISALLLIFTHRSNIKRLLNGTEHRFNVLGRFR
jgi:glycerol-3-phosphate acyltransferase PlsY